MKTNPAALIAVAVALICTSAMPARCGPIHDAARKGDKARVASLLNQNADLVFSRDKLGYTALHIAAQSGKVDVAALLLDHGADVNATAAEVQGIDEPRRSYGHNQPYSGETPLTLALVPYHHEQMLNLLVSRGAVVNVVLRDGVTPLLRAVQLDHPYDVELLLADGADPNAKDINGRTPLHWAALTGKADIATLLLDHGANPNAKDFYGSTPASYATLRFYEKVATLIRSHGGH